MHTYIILRDAVYVRKQQRYTSQSAVTSMTRVHSIVAAQQNCQFSVVFYAQPYICMCECVCVCVCVCVCIYIVFCVHKIEKNVVAEYCLPLVREGYECFLTSDSVQYSISFLY